MSKIHIRTNGRYLINRDQIRARILETLKSKDVVSDCYISIAIVGDRKMRALNEGYKKHEGTTDVLSFPYTEPAKLEGREIRFVNPQADILILGDIVVSYPEAVRQAKEENKLVDEKINFLVEHGLLHLLGYHHE